VIERVKALGIFGNSKINYNNDWVTVISENLDGIISTSEKNAFWDQET